MAGSGEPGHNRPTTAVCYVDDFPGRPGEGGGDCEGCDGSGVRAPATPSCVFLTDAHGWVFVERCDLCEIFPDDLAAASSLFRDFKWIQCVTDGWHVLGRNSESV